MTANAMSAQGIVTAALLYLTAAACCAADQPAPWQSIHPSVQVFTEAPFSHTDVRTPPGFYGSPRVLPDIWSGDRRFDHSPSGWYRFDLPATVPEEPWSILLAKFTQNVEVFFNGKLIGQTAPSGEEPVNFNRPFLFSLPSAYWREADNRLEVRLTTMKTWGALAPIAVGPSRWLQPRYDHKFFVQITANQMAALISAFILLVSLYFWRLDPSTNTYLWLAVLAACWVMYTLNNFLTSYPLPHEWWRVVRRASIDLFGYAYVCFVHRFIGVRRPLLERLLAVYVMAMTGVYFYFSIVIEERLSYAVHMLSSIAGLYAAVVTVGALRRSFDHRNLVLLFVVVLTMLFTIHDSIYATGLRLGGLIQESYLGQLGVPLLFSFLLLMIAREFQRASVAARDANIHLESRVQAVSSALEASYERQRQAERRHATLMERDRISRDIHDDLGSKLLSLVYTASSESQARLARSALEDMRSIVASPTDEAHEILQDFGGEWHAEVAARTREAGLILEWRCPSQVLLEPHQGQQLSRALRELVTNVLKHANCSTLTVSAQFEQRTLVIRVEDDGIGMADAVANTGITSIRHRISELSGTVDWTSAPGGGTRAVIRLPMA